jgi:hypothetical protein
LINSCRTVFGRWPAARGELGSRVLGLPPLPLRDGLQQQNRPGRHVGIGGRGAFPPVRPIPGAVNGVDAGMLQKLPNELAALSPVIV